MLTENWETLEEIRLRSGLSAEAILAAIRAGMANGTVSIRLPEAGKTQCFFQRRGF